LYFWIGRMRGRTEGSLSAATCFIDARTGVCAGSVQVPGFVALIRGCPRLIVWLSSGLRGPGTAGQERLKKGLLCSLVAATGTSLLNLHGIGPSGAARLLVEVGDLSRFPDRNHFASWTGTAPIDASSGDHVRHRLSRGGNRQINRVLHIMATVQLRTRTTEGRAYFDRKKAGGKTSMEALRCLKRRLSDIVYRTMLGDYTAGKVTGPGGHRGNDSDSSATGSQPHTGSSDKPLPGPATTQPRTPLPAAS
jgi:hypothetical protein